MMLACFTLKLSRSRAEEDLSFCQRPERRIPSLFLFFFFFFLHGEIIKAGRIGKMANWIRSPIREGN